MAEVRPTLALGAESDLRGPCAARRARRTQNTSRRLFVGGVKVSAPPCALIAACLGVDRVMSYLARRVRVSRAVRCATRGRQQGRVRAPNRDGRFCVCAPAPLSTPLWLRRYACAALSGDAAQLRCGQRRAHERSAARGNYSGVARQANLNVLDDKLPESSELKPFSAGWRSATTSQTLQLNNFP